MSAKPKEEFVLGCAHDIRSLRKQPENSSVMIYGLLENSTRTLQSYKTVMVDPKICFIFVR